MDIHRTISKGVYDTDFSNLKQGASFPSSEVRGRSAVYRYYKRLYSGEYGKNKKLIARVNSQETEIPYKVIPLNFFKLIVNKLIGMIFNGEVTIKSNDIEKDKVIRDLVERTNWISGIMRAVKMAEVMGDCPIKTFVDGISAFEPHYCYKVVSKHNKDEVNAYVVFEYLFDKPTDPISHIRIEVHTKGQIKEVVFTFTGDMTGGTIGVPVDYVYRGREIPASGATYETGVDIELIQWIGINKDIDSVYGQSSFIDIKDIVFTLEQRLSSELYVLDNHEKPFLIVGMNNIVTNEETGAYELKQINGKYLVRSDSDSQKSEYLTWDGKLDNSHQYREDLLSYFYELTEMGKTFLSGEYSGNISEETLNNTIKSAIDRANRDLGEIWYDIRRSLYVLCRLNGIDVKIEELSINFNIGRADSDKIIAEIISTLTQAGMFSKATLLERYFGYSREQAQQELELIKKEG